MVLPFTLWSPGEEEVRVCVCMWSWASENGHMLCTIMVVQFVRSHAQSSGMVLEEWRE